MPKATSVINATADASITTFLWSNFIGVSGLDYIAFFTGETAEMVKVMDGVKNGTFVSAFAEAELMPPATLWFRIVAWAGLLAQLRRPRTPA